MRIAVIADVHANLPALRAVIDDVTAIGCDAVWCAGDVVGRGPHPNEVVEEMRRLAIPTVQGNWDEALGMGREVTGAIWASPDAEAEGYASLAWTDARMTEENCSWLRQLPGHAAHGGRRPDGAPLPRHADEAERVPLGGSAVPVLRAHRQRRGR